MNKDDLLKLNLQFLQKTKAILKKLTKMIIKSQKTITIASKKLIQRMK